MESAVKDEQEAEQEAGRAPSTVTSTCRGTKDTDLGVLSNKTVMESELLQPPTSEMLSNETINTGTPAKDRGASHRSHDGTPTNHNTQGTHHATFSGERESSHAVVETVTEERFVDRETRPLKEENKTHCEEPETSSDDTDDWETASEKSFALDLEPHDPYRVREETWLCGQEKPNEDTGLHGPKTISEDAGPPIQETVSEEDGLHSHETVNENAGTHSDETLSESAGPPIQKTVSEEDGLHSHKTVSEDAESHHQETVSKVPGSHSHETVSENAEPHGRETVSKVAGPPSQDTLSEDVRSQSQEIDGESHGFEIFSKEAELHGHEMVSEDAGPHGHYTISDNAWDRGPETVREEPELHSHETVRKDAGPYDQKTVNEVDELHGLESVSEETLPFGLEMSWRVAEPLGHGDMETDNREAAHQSLDTSDDNSRSFGQETVNERAEPHGQEIVSEEAEPFSHDNGDTSDDTRSYGQETVNEEAEPNGQKAVNVETGSYGKGKMWPTVYKTVNDWTNPNEETVSDLVRPLGNKTVGDVTGPCAGHVELQENETVSGMGSEEFGEDCKISSYKDNESAIFDQTWSSIPVTVSEEATNDKKETSSREEQDDNKRSDRETVKDELKSGVRKGSRSDGTDGHFFTQDVYIETVNEDVSNVSKETFHEQPHVLHAERGDAENQDVYKSIDSHEISGIYKQTVGDSISTDSHETELGDACMVDTFKKMKEVLSEEGIIIVSSSEEGGMAENQVLMKSIEDCECNDEFSKASRVLDEGATNEDELKNDDDDSKQKWGLSETSCRPALTEEVRITNLECERLEETLDSIKTLVGIGDGLSEQLRNIMNQEAALEFQYSTPVTIDEESYIGCLMDLETQLDLRGPPPMEEKEPMDYAKTLSETKSIEPESLRPTHTLNEPYDNLGLGYNTEPEVQVVFTDGQGIVDPCLQLSELPTEQGTPSKDDSIIDLQTHRLGDQKPVQEEVTTVEMFDPRSSPHFSWVGQSTQEVPRDEPDHYKLEFFPITLKGIGVVSAELDPNSMAQDLLPESIDTERITREESTKESVHQQSTLGDIHPAIEFDQDSVTPGSETAKPTATKLENVKLRRQRSNTDPGLIHEQEKLQASADTDCSSRGRVRSITPPCDKFTSSFSPASPKTREQSTTSVLHPIMGENKNLHLVKDTSAKEYKFYPTQIFNPMLLLGHTQEEFGFYQRDPLRQGNVGNVSQRPLTSPPQDIHVLHPPQNPEIIVDPKSLPKSTEGTSNIIQPMSAPSVAPVWLPPQRTRYVGDSGGLNEMRSMKTPENPLVRRATIRHKRSNVGVKPTTKRFSNPNLPAIPQTDYLAGPGTSILPKIQSVNVSRIQISSRNRHLPQKQMISEETGKSRSSPSMETLREEGQPAVREKPSNNPESILLRGTRSKNKSPPSDPSQSIHRRYSTLINSSNLLYQEYSDVAQNQEIQRQKPGDSPAEDSLPSSPRVRRRILSSQDSYLQRLSISSADSLWQDIPKIRDSVTFLAMTREEQKLQEAKFELIMSEALYLRSLNIAVDHFQRSAELQEVLSAQDRQWLFSRLCEVRDASSDFLFDLEEEFEGNMYSFQVCDVLIGHEPTFRRVYLPYVTNQTYQDRTFQRLMNGNPRFQQVLARLESDPVCQRLSLKSFLILPFQRITRMRLLLQNILKRSAPGSAEELQATEAHNAVEKLIRDCNDGVQRMKDTEELILLNQKIQFECKIFPLISQSRRLVKHGEVMTLEFNSTSFKSKVTTRPVYLHLFSDCLLLSRVREGGRFVVFDHSSDVRVERCEIKLHTNQKNIFRVFLRDSAAMGRETSHDVREAEYIFRTETQSQKLRWISALSPSKEEIDFWRDHGLSQMQCIKSYKGRENDELSLEKADILIITQNSDDGWLHGIRLSDQHSGWFPQSNVQPISRNACLRNLQEEQRLKTARAKLQPTGAKGQ